ncbi:MAG: protein jag [Chloroflexi bacterium]|nr:MAG: protein jag [Chloroflexota bacterium]
MANQNENLDVSAKSVEEAIEIGLAELGLTRDEVDIQILNEGKRGLFGIGSEEATVRLSVRSQGQPPAPPPEPSTEEPAETAPTASIPETEPAATGTESNGDDAVSLAKKHLENVLQLMGVEATVEVRTAADLVEQDEEPPAVLDITGNDLGILIGRRSETLQALQYMIRLMVSKDTGRWERVVVDVESYRSRRRESLQKMAHRMAERAVANQERVVLESMTPYERRIIHIALRDNPNVYTKSIGRDSNRKVTIIPK